MMNGLPSHNDFYENLAEPRSPRSRNYMSGTGPMNNRSVSQGYPPPPPPPHEAIYDELNQHINATRYGDRMSSNMPGDSYGGYDMSMPPPPPAQAWNHTSFAQNQHLAALGATTRGRAQQGRGRAPFPPAWLDHNTTMQLGGQAEYPPFQPNSRGLSSPLRPDQLHQENEDDLIPTAIVIKNIPFAVKKEQLLDMMTKMALPLPYAFNYHFDHGVFRGLAFANFSSPEDTAQVIHAMNHMEVMSRKLRVEYKKMLPQAERDRIEREKREKRGQLEEQHRPTGTSQLHSQSSMNSMSSHVHGGTSPSPVPGPGTSMTGLDMNDPVTFEYHNQIYLWLNSNEGDSKTFPASVTPPDRTIIHTIAHNLQLGHESRDIPGEGRCVRIFRRPHGPNGSSTPVSAYHLDPHRRQLNRAATTDFSNVRSDSLYGNPPQSPGYLGISEAQNSLSAAANLRAAKSNPSLRSREPSPSSMHFPPSLSTNVSRFQDYSAGSPGSGRANFTPTTTMPSAATDSILGGFAGMNLNSAGPGFGPNSSGSPQRLRGNPSWDRESTASNNVPGPIGGHRTYSGNQDENRGRNLPGSMRNQQRNGAIGDRTTGTSYLRRQNGHQPRGSDELSSPSGVDMGLEK